MKILIVHPHLLLGGAELQIIHLSNELQKKGHKVSIATLYVSNNVRKQIDGLDIILPADPEPLRLKSLDVSSVPSEISKMRKLRKLVKMYYKEYDVINPHNFPAVWSCVNLDKPVVWVCNEPPDPLWANPDISILLKIIRRISMIIDKSLVNKIANTIIVLDELNAKRVYERYERNSDIIPPGVDYDYFSSGNAENARSKFELTGRFVITQVGGFIPQKDQLSSIKAVESVVGKIPNIKLVLIGENKTPYGKVVDEYLSRSSIRENVLLTGSIPMDDVRNLLAASAITIFPVKSQTWGMAPIEGLCCKTIPIVSPDAGVAFLLKKEKIGVVTNDFVNAIADIHSNPLKYRDIVEKGNNYVKENLTWHRCCSDVIKNFEKTRNEYVNLV